MHCLCLWCTACACACACAIGIVCDAVATTGPPSINCCLLPSDHHHHQWPRIAKDHWSSHIIMITITPGSLVVCFTLIISDKSYDHHCSVHSWSQLISDHHLRQCEPPSVHQSIVISSYQSYQPTVCDNFQKRFGSKIFCIEFLKQEIGEIPSFTQLHFAPDNSNRSYMVKGKSCLWVNCQEGSDLPQLWLQYAHHTRHKEATLDKIVSKLLSAHPPKPLPFPSSQPECLAALHSSPLTVQPPLFQSCIDRWPLYRWITILILISKDGFQRSI